MSDPLVPSGSRSRDRTRRVAPIEHGEADLPEAWRRRPWVPTLIIGILIAAVLGTGLLMGQALKSSPPSALAGCLTSTQTGPQSFIGPQPICIGPSRHYQATVNTTQGVIVIQLHPEIAPVTVNNFVVLSIHGYYDRLAFWKSEDWVVQSGDPRGDGRGGPGYSLPDEPNTTPAWDLGAVGMARVPGGAVKGSQFFIVKGPWPRGGPTAVYNRFGTVISGMDKAQALTTTDRINSITIQVS